MTARTFERTADRSLYATYSMHVSRARVAELLGGAPTLDVLRRLQRIDPASVALANAIDPLFNDIADRERGGEIYELLLATPGPSVRVLTAQLPDYVEWATEGIRFRATPPGLSAPKALRMRRFWFTHADGGVSYNISLRFDYAHTPADFFFISLLQKLIAPKEFALDGRRAGAAMHVGSGNTGVYALDQLTIATADTAAMPFWAFVRGQFDDDANELFGALARARGRRPSARPSFDRLIDHDPYGEVDGLSMPRARSSFFFRDVTFFDCLLPYAEDGQTQSRTSRVRRPGFAAYTEEIRAAAERLSSENGQVLDLKPDFWQAVAAQDAVVPHGLTYLFLAGFNQNIIDFLNQDGSEVLDSLDPIYPQSDEQAAESFFVRYANPRALITFVAGSRSLEVGNDFLGTCPYAFLIHIASNHNENLAREHERAAQELLRNVRALPRRRTRDAAELFYRFRKGAYAAWQNNRYTDIFRYDTERDVFAAVEKLRGTSRRSADLERVLSGLESETRDLEAQSLRRDEQRMNLLLGALGVFSVFQMMFQWRDELQTGPNGAPPMLEIAATAPFLSVHGTSADSPADWLAVAATIGSMAFTIGLVLFVLYVILRRHHR